MLVADSIPVISARQNMFCVVIGTFLSLIAITYRQAKKPSHQPLFIWTSMGHSISGMQWVLRLCAVLPLLLFNISKDFVFVGGG